MRRLVSSSSTTWRFWPTNDLLGRGLVVATALALLLYLPLRPVKDELRKNFTRAMRVSGHLPLPVASDVLQRNGVVIVAAASTLSALALIVVWRRQRRRGLEVVDPFPWQLLALGGGAV